MSEKNIIKKQQEALINTRNFIKKQNLKNPLTGKIWKLLNEASFTLDENIVIHHIVRFFNSDFHQSKISYEDSLKLKDNWSKDLIGELQRELVNYQLYQMKIDNPPELFKVIKDVFDKIDDKNLEYKLLDVGCTSGYYFEIINFYFPGIFKYNGCDYNSESIKLAKKHYPNVNFFVDDLNKLSVDSNEYDITFLSGVIEHIPEYAKGLNELCRITKKYIVLHRIWLQDGPTTCSKGTQYFVPVIRSHYNKKTFFDILEKQSFMPVWSSNIYDGNNKTYLLKKI